MLAACTHHPLQMALLAVLLLSVVVGGANARSTGAPAAACDTLTPQHGGSSQSNTPYVINMDQFSDGDGGFWYTPGQTYTCEFTSTVPSTV